MSHIHDTITPKLLPNQGHLYLNPLDVFMEIIESGHTKEELSNTIELGGRLLCMPHSSEHYIDLNMVNTLKSIDARYMFYVDNVLSKFDSQQFRLKNVVRKKEVLMCELNELHIDYLGWYKHDTVLSVIYHVDNLIK